MLTLTTTVAALNRIKRASMLTGIGLRIARAVVLGAMTVSVWALVRPSEELEQLALGGVALLVAALAGVRRSGDLPVGIPAFALAMEMRHGKGRSETLTSLAPEAPLPLDWREPVHDFRDELRRFEISRNVALASSLVLPLAVMLVTLPQAVPSFKLALSEVSNVVSRLSRGATLRVVQGGTTEMPEKGITLSASEPAQIELLAQNLLEVTVTGGFGKAAPTVELRKAAAGASEGGDAAAVYQSFQMLPLRDAGRPESEETSRHQISFAVENNVALHIPALSEKPLAILKVRQLPVPKVTLTNLSEAEDPWPDDQPLNLRIQVDAENPLQAVRLLIKSGQKTSRELVANVMAEDKTQLTTEYRLVLETYVESDLAQVEIVAEAIDRAVPTPLVGHSEPLRLNTASAYGRYRAALQTLRELKETVDDALGKKQDGLDPKASELAQKAAAQSERSPFFDGLDRVQIHRFQGKVDELGAVSSMEGMLDLSQQLNDFLFEHEILDDRERDRDFFVATRSLSRLVEQEPGKRPMDVKTITERMRKFLDDREQRWDKRVARLPDPQKPSRWANVKQHRPYHQSMDRIDKLEETAKADPKARSTQLEELSKAVVDYRAWIEELEAKEDAAREAEEKQRQEGLASAKNTLRELQQRQGEISADLDRAGERPQSEIAEKWPGTRMKQNANARETKQLEGQMRSLSPAAAQRIEAAHQAMEQTGEAGNGNDYQLAETSSDLAGRLLRQAEKAASQSQQKRRSRGRRRRVTGDNYYGQSVVGGDVEIKREYQVDRRYREDILDEVQGADLDEDQRALLESYLRQVIR